MTTRLVCKGTSPEVVDDESGSPSTAWSRAQQICHENLAEDRMPPPDYLAWYRQRHVVKPKLEQEVVEGEENGRGLRFAYSACQTGPTSSFLGAGTFGLERGRVREKVRTGERMVGN